MKVAIEFRRVGSAFRRETVALTRHSQRKAQRLLSKRRLESGHESRSGDLKQRKPDSASFSEAIRLAQQGDAAAFEFIYKHYCGRVYALCLRMLHDPVEAEDLVQEVFIQLFRKIHTYRGESAFSTWLHRLTANLVLMRLRKKKPVSISLDAPQRNRSVRSAAERFDRPDQLAIGYRSAASRLQGSIYPLRCSGLRA